MYKNKGFMWFEVIGSVIIGGKKNGKKAMRFEYLRIMCLMDINQLESLLMILSDTKVEELYQDH